MISKHVVIVGAGPCGLAALKEMLEAGHTAVALDKAPAIGGVFRGEDDPTYENLYLTISSYLMAFSDFPPLEPRIKYSSKQEYQAYLEAYADAFDLRRHIRLCTEVVRAHREAGRWRIEIRGPGSQTTEVLEADALVVATGSNHVPRRVELPGFTGRVVHSSEYRRPEDFAGQRVLVVGAGESAFDIAADLSEVAAETVVWSRSAMAPAPRFPGMLNLDPAHDELQVMKDEARWSRTKISDFLEVMTTSRMANAAPMWAYSTIRHFIFRVMPKLTPAARVNDEWNLHNIAGEPLRGDQASIPTKSARLCTVVARGKARAVSARTATFDGRRLEFTDVIDDRRGDRSSGSARVVIDPVDVAVLCTGYRTDFAWLEVDGLDWNPRTWFKHCLPPGFDGSLAFMGWARPHQGGIPPCAEILSRYLAMVLAGTRALPLDHAERAAMEGADEHAFYVKDQHSPNLVDYPAFMDSVARLIGCLPAAPKPPAFERLVQYWVYPNWPLWYRMHGPGARPDVVEAVLSSLPLRTSYAPNPFNLMALAFSLMQLPVDTVRRPRAGLRGTWAFKAKKHILHGNART
ncbi:flavin-containing monooxygenase [Paraliomyxa miuraensis]|uniref:flavin-containing monooxygenase n=1 Tax=Paraliomyxa miuraensis TaxID=376150 RepID=UPI00225141CB|nr:NAD(P)-binding domain-containing protein [Paraliomyxa miuraensis]MCX4240255.1 NAD(P)-binding domain-containing protein [Paraliomyxa miuraensis]